MNWMLVSIYRFSSVILDYIKAEPFNSFALQAHPLPCYNDVLSGEDCQGQLLFLLSSLNKPSNPFINLIPAFPTPCINRPGQLLPNVT